MTELTEALIKEVFLPKYQAFIVEELRNQDKTQSAIREKIDKNDIDWVAFWRAWHEFEKAHVITPVSRGRGRERLWHLSIRKEEKQEKKAAE